jgi:hypothetical protein
MKKARLWDVRNVLNVIKAKQLRNRRKHLKNSLIMMNSWDLFWIISIREETPTTASGPASPPPSSRFPEAPKIVGLLRIMPLFMAFLYQSTLKCGTDGGLRLNEPEMEKCGIFICGRLHSKLKIPFSQSTRPETNERIFSNTVVNADLMPSRMLVAVDRIDSRPEEMSDCRLLMTDVIYVRIEFQAVDAACCTAAKTVAVVV